MSFMHNAVFVTLSACTGGCLGMSCKCGILGFENVKHKVSPEC